MVKPLVVAQSRVVEVPPEKAFRETMQLPLPELFSHWYGPIPPIKEVRDQTGDWDAPGRSRRLIMPGGSVREELNSVDPPRSFGYRLTDITGPMALLIGSVTGVWNFDQVGDGTEITWRWTIYPKSRLAGPALPVFGMVWKGYARRALKYLSERLAR
ncbi:SRPBCC family protein [Mycobacterium sp.]|uniref:SRPBCC family protein n=1 Tax=Mycobacterium sp. TaxID=1785 RepID=UPI0025D09141|nr:SRPBCC family protein [Mycobacterium sp.]MBW0015347.1 SRPBCC family protein [Mycobacterium sp.]